MEEGDGGKRMSHRGKKGCQEANQRPDTILFVGRIRKGRRLKDDLPP